MLNATCITPNNWRKKKLVEIIPSKSIINYSRNKVETKLFDNKNITHSVSSSKVEPLIKSKKISALSIKSIEFKKRIVEKSNQKHFENKPFTINKLIKYWEHYLNKIELEGKQNILSILKMDTPRLKNDFNIEFEVENSINKIELTNELEYIMPFLKEKLNNQNITFNIIINPKHIRKMIHSPEERYKKMESINPNLSLLKKTFNLDL
tara:strand:+ start:6186 stop:6809 length:624 start_codon:yes stop_codon:yes gene_type:complete